METATSTGKRWFIHNLATIHAGSDAVGLVEMVGRKGDMPPLHVHTDADEVFYVLEGELSVFVGEEHLELAAGESACGPKGVPHAYRVESDEARWLAVAAPGGFERFVFEASEPAPVEGLPPADREIDPEELGRLAAEHGIELLGPPGALPG